MNGAIFFSSKYGSTAEYAHWISDATGLPAFDVNKSGVDPSKFDFLILGSPVIYHKLMFHAWALKNAAVIKNKPTILFSVSGAGAGPKLSEKPMAARQSHRHAVAGFHCNLTSS